MNTLEVTLSMTSRRKRTYTFFVCKLNLHFKKSNEDNEDEVGIVALRSWREHALCGNPVPALSHVTLTVTTVAIFRV